MHKVVVLMLGPIAKLVGYFFPERVFVGLVLTTDLVKLVETEQPQKPISVGRRFANPPKTREK